MKKTLRYYMTTILIILLILVSTYSYAAEITKESLTKFVEDYIKKGEYNGNIEITDTEMIIETEEGEDKLQYDLKDKPTFYVNTTFKKGMTYDECTKATTDGLLGVMGFSMVAGIKGVDVSKAMYYSMFSIVSETEEQSILNSKEKTINVSTFVDGIDYAEKVYSKDIEIKDDLFTILIKKAELKGEEYIVETKFVVNTEKEFSIIAEKFEENMKTSGLEYGSIITGIIREPIETTNTTPTQTPLPTKTPSTANIGTMPNAGFELNVINILKVVLGLSISALIVYGIYNKRYNSK